MSNYNYLYVIFLIALGGVVIGAAFIDFEDKGDCIRAFDGELKMRKPGSSAYVSTDYCIIINK